MPDPRHRASHAGRGGGAAERGQAIGAAPPPDVVQAFGGELKALKPLAGGQGASWRAGQIVLKPVPLDEPIAWTAALFDQIDDCQGFRLARPVRGAGGEWRRGGWAATTWVEGDHDYNRWDEMLAACGAFHAALARADLPPPPTFGRQAAPWQIGAAVAWGDAAARPGIHPAVARALERLAALLEQPWAGGPDQIIHGDFGGNLLFSKVQGVAPAVIDFSPLVRPAAFPEAIVVVDAIAWRNAASALVASFKRRACGAQLLARAVAYRLVTTDQLWATSRPERADVETAGFLPVIAVIEAGCR